MTARKIIISYFAWRLGRIRFSRHGGVCVGLAIRNIWKFTLHFICPCGAKANMIATRAWNRRACVCPRERTVDPRSSLLPAMVRIVDKLIPRRRWDIELWRVVRKSYDSVKKFSVVAWLRWAWRRLYSCTHVYNWSHWFNSFILTNLCKK